MSAKCNKDIANSNNLSLSTVKKYLSQVYARFDVHSRLELLVEVNKRLQKGTNDGHDT